MNIQSSDNKKDIQKKFRYCNVIVEKIENFLNIVGVIYPIAPLDFCQNIHWLKIHVYKKKKSGRFTRDCRKIENFLNIVGVVCPEGRCTT